MLDSQKVDQYCAGHLENIVFWVPMLLVPGVADNTSMGDPGKAVTSERKETRFDS